MSTDAPLTIQRIAIFPLPGAVLFPGLHLPLHIFEPRYKAMVQEVLARDRQIGIVPNGLGQFQFEIGSPAVDMRPPCREMRERVAEALQVRMTITENAFVMKRANGKLVGFICPHSE